MVLNVMPRFVVGALPFLALLGVLLGVSGCASSRPSAPSPPVPADDPLPGSGRVPPSEQNVVAPGAPAAFPGYPGDLGGSGAPTRSPQAMDSRGTPPGLVDPGSAAPPSAPAAPPGSRPDAPVPAPLAVTFAVQLQVATEAERAQVWRERATLQLGVEVRVDLEDGFHKLRVGAYSSKDAAEEMRRRAVAAGWVDAFVVPVGSPAPDGGAR